MQRFIEEELNFTRVEGIGSIVMLKRVRTFEPYDNWYVVDQVEKCGKHRKRTTRTHADFMAANEDYRNRLARMKEKR